MKRYSVDKIRLSKSGKFWGSDVNFYSLEVATKHARQCFYGDDVVEVLIHDQIYDIPILHPIFREIKPKLLNDNIDNYRKFWEDRLESICPYSKYIYAE